MNEMYEMNEWNNVVNLLKNDMEKINHTRTTISFNDYITAIVSDLHMNVSINKIPDMDNPEKFIKFCYNIFPLNEFMLWELIKKIIRVYYLSLGKNEYIACVRRDDGKNMIFKERADVEFNDDFVQLIAVILPFIKYNDQKIFVFVKESKSDMAGYTTMLGGHITYRKYDKFRDLVKYNVLKELQEELGINDLSYLKFDYDLNHLAFATFKSVLPGEISYYHAGYSFQIEIPKTLIFESKLEPGKEFVLWCKEKTDADIRDNLNHTIKIYNNLDNLNPDCWLKEFINAQ